MTEYQVGEGIRLKATFKDVNENITDPTNQTISIKNSDGTELISGATPFKDTEGKYYYDYSIPTTGPTGRWKGIWEGETENLNAIKEVEFYVEESP